MSELRHAIGVLHETKPWERRVPLVPAQVAELVEEGIEVRVERSRTRAFRDEEFSAAGATLVDDATDCRFLMGVKEVKTSQVRPGQTVMCFSHTIKGQAHNMPLLAHFLAIGASLIDYEVIVDDHGVRQVAFGRYAGLCGAHETLWTLGRRLAALGHETPLTRLRHAVEHFDLAALTAATREVLARLEAEPCAGLAPFVVGVTGNGRVSLGALEYLDAAGGKRVSIDECVALLATPDQGERERFGRAMHVLHLEDALLYERAGALFARRAFDFRDYLAHPELYWCKGAMYLPYLSAVVNGLYWDERFPRLLDASTLHRMHKDKTLPLVIGDVACDIRGGVEWTVQATENDAPSFVYDPRTETAMLGVVGDGATIMSVDNLPAALPRDASVDFSRALSPFVRPFFGARFDGSWKESLSAALQQAVVVAGGKLGDRHAHLAKFVRAARE